MDVQELHLRFLQPALTPMIDNTQQREMEFALPAVYSSLLNLLQTLLTEHPQRVFEGPAANRCSGFAPLPMQSPSVVCRRCGCAIATAADFSVIRDRLHAAGLPTEHLELCPDCRA